MSPKKKSSWLNQLMIFGIIFALGYMLIFRKGGCGPQRTGLQPQDARTVDVLIGRWRVRAEVADTPELRRKGLMHREQLGQGYGMLFVFDRPAVQSFWMKNTIIPLSIAFMREDGRIVKIAKMHPSDLTAIPSGEPVKYTLEVRQGWFEERGVKPGAHAVLPASIPPPPPPPPEAGGEQSG